MSTTTTALRFGGDDLEVAFWQFHEENPQVYSLLRDEALKKRRAGATKLGIAKLYEQIRWEMAHGVIPEDDCFVLNNNHRALYARFLMEQEPELRGFFESRTRVSTRRPVCA